MDGLAERTDVRAGATGSTQQLRSAQRGALGVIFGLYAIPAAFAGQLADCVLLPAAPNLIGGRTAIPAAFRY
jgi:hypothetical protein